MNNVVSPNTQAILLLTAPLIVGRGEKSTAYLTHWEYKKFARLLRARNYQPSDLLGTEINEILADISDSIDVDRIKKLLGRGFLLSQAIDRWMTRSIWVISRADSQYPYRLKERLKDDSPAILYGCGDVTILDSGGLAVVGSRRVDDTLVEYTRKIGHLTAEANITLVSGGAKGIDQAAMRGALEGSGRVAGVMADSLERASVERANRLPFMDEQLVLISPYDPTARFNVGHAMQRNKLIYALSDAALVVSSDYNKGGTWTGATEQLDKMKYAPIFVRVSGEINKGLEQLRIKGARPWPDPEIPEDLVTIIQTSTQEKENKEIQADLFLSGQHNSAQNQSLASGDKNSKPDIIDVFPDDISALIYNLLKESENPLPTKEIAACLNIKTSELKPPLKFLVDEGFLDKLLRPVRYRICVAKQSRLFHANEESID